MNPNHKRTFEPNFFSQFNPIKKVRLENGTERPAYALFQASPIKPNNLPNDSNNERRPLYKAQHKCKPGNPLKSAQFKARPMPNFSNPFVPKLFKHTTTSIQEFNLSCYHRSASKTSAGSRCDSSESQFGNSFLSQRTEPVNQSGFKARPAPDFSKFIMAGKKKENMRQEDMEVDSEQMDID